MTHKLQQTYYLANGCTTRHFKMEIGMAKEIIPRLDMIYLNALLSCRSKVFVLFFEILWMDCSLQSPFQFSMNLIQLNWICVKLINKNTYILHAENALSRSNECNRTFQNVFYSCSKHVVKHFKSYFYHTPVEDYKLWAKLVRLATRCNSPVAMEMTRMK